MKLTQEALKLALEALEGFYEYGYDRRECFEHITAIKEALAQTQEPEYAWPTVADYERDVGFQTNEAFRMAWVMARTTNKMLGHPSTPQRTWVGLTDEELQPIADEYRILFGSWVEDFARAIEAKLKGKNT